MRKWLQQAIQPFSNAISPPLPRSSWTLQAGSAQRGQSSCMAITLVILAVVASMNCNVPICFQWSRRAIRLRCCRNTCWWAMPPSWNAKCPALWLILSILSAGWTVRAKPIPKIAMVTIAISRAKMYASCCNLWKYEKAQVLTSRIEKKLLAFHESITVVS